MRTLTTMQVRGLRGQRFDASLTGADLWAGPNGAGKSTHLDAVTLGLRGAAQTPTDPARVYLGPEPSGHVTLTFGTSHSVHRDLALGPATAAARKVDGVADAVAGGHLTRWDLADFAALTDAGRAKILNAICDAAGAAGAWTVDRIGGHLREAVGIPAGHVLADLLRVVPPWGPSVGEWLGQSLEWVRGEYTAANAAVKQAAAQAAPDGGEEEAPWGDLAMHRVRSAALNNELCALADSLASVEAEIRRATAAREEGERLATDVGLAEDALAATEASLVALRATLRPGPAPAAEPTASDAVAAARAATRCAVEQEGAAVLAARLLERRLAGAQAAEHTLRALAGQAGGACHHCGATDPLGLVERADRADTETVETADLLDDAQAREAQARRTYRQARAAEDAAGDALRNVQEANRAAAVSARGYADRIAEHEGYVAQRREALARATEAMVAWQRRQGEPATAGPVGDLAVLRAQHAATTRDLGKTRDLVEAHVRRAERQRAQQDAIARRETAAARFASVRALGEALKSLQAAIAAEAYQPIQDAADALLTEAGLTLRVLFRSEADWGATDARGYRPFWALSDSERAIVGAALAVAFARLSGSPWPAVLLDRLEVVDADHLPGVLRALAAGAQRGDWQFLGALVATDPAAVPQVEGLAVHWLGPQA